MALSEFTKGILWVLGGVSIHLFLGWLYLYGNIQVYITSYFHIYDDSISLNTTLIIGPILTTMQGIAIFIGPFLMKYMNPRLVIAIGLFICLGSVFAATFTTNFIVFAILFALFGIGIGIAYLIPLLLAWEFFPQRKGLLSGIIVGAFGFGAFFFGFISLAIVNPSNESPTIHTEGGDIFDKDSKPARDAPKMIRINWAIWLGLSLLGVLLINKKKRKLKVLSSNGDSQPIENNVNTDPLLKSKEGQGQGLKNVDSNPIELYHSSSEGTEKYIDEYEGYYEEDSSGKQTDSFASTVYVPFKSAIRDYRSYIIFIVAPLSLLQGTLVSFIFKNYGLENINDDAFITTVGTIGSVMNGISRGFWGVLIDKFPYKYVFGSLMIIQIIIGLTISQIVEYKALYLIWIGISFFWLGGHFSITPTIFAKLFGAKTGSKMYSLWFFLMIPSGIIALVLSKTLYKSIGYGKIFYITAGVTWVGLFLLLFFKQNR